MKTEPNDAPFVFPKWANYLLPIVAISVIGGAFYAPTVVALGFSPQATAVGYMPVQPVPYSHALHAGKLGLDCRYCHNTVEKTAFAAIPPTQTCMNCHTGILTKSPRLQAVRESWSTGSPIPWVKIHNLAQYVYFNHSAHVTHGVGCIECHGRIDQMDQVYQSKPLSMGWCLDCHRNIATHLRPVEQVTNMNWTRGTSAQEQPDALMKQYNIHEVQYMTSCSTCHR